MRVEFFKYQATGNDFVIVDNRQNGLTFSTDQIRQICDRKFGVGADGLILIEKDNHTDFNLVYYNGDGSQSLCGNGSRAAVSFASFLGLVNGSAVFNAYDGIHDAEIESNTGLIRLKMKDVTEITRIGDDFFINTGSPHYVRVVEHLESFDVFNQGERIRHSERFKPGGTNVNFIELQPDNTVFVRTFERGVENETLSCGTGVTAAAIAAAYLGYVSPVRIRTLGGELAVEFVADDNLPETGQGGTFSEVYLTGPAKMVFKGELEL
ncbi:MAG TPA: diaminopimelate epimerase [Ohtaekwangia sp.]|nr:diaminopimelate epimerase [Ohtaekwangia sp.]